MFPTGPTETQNQNNDNSNGRRVKFTILMEEFWDTRQTTREKQTVQPQTEEQFGKRACVVTARGSISKATKGLVSGAAAGSAECRKRWTTALIPGSSGASSSDTSSLGRRQIPDNPQRCEGTRTQQNRNRFAPTCQTGTCECQVLQANDKNIWMPSLPSQVQDRKEDSSESSTSSQSSGRQEIFQKNVDSYSIRSSRFLK